MIVGNFLLWSDHHLNIGLNCQVFKRFNHSTNHHLNTPTIKLSVNPMNNVVRVPTALTNQLYRTHALNSVLKLENLFRPKISCCINQVLTLIKLNSLSCPYFCKKQKIKWIPVLKFTVGDWIPNTLEYRTFLSAVFQWSKTRWPPFCSAFQWSRPLENQTCG